MRRLISAVVGATCLVVAPVPGDAQNMGEVFRQVAPSVVVIRAKGRDVDAGGVNKFGEIGSGVLISPDGKVMTAAHVVHSMDEILVEFLGGETVSAQVVGSEPAADLSLLKLDRVPAGAQPALLADSSKVRIGDQIVIVGAPYGLSYALSVGWISARWAPNTVYKTMPLAEFFQTDAVINTGTSGGPMFNTAGEVVGLVSHNISKGGGSEGLGFVVTANTARALLLEKRSMWSGLEGQFLSDDMSDILNLPPRAVGYIVKTVAKGSPADTMGIRGGNSTASIAGEQIVVGGDILLTYEGIPIAAVNLPRIRQMMNGLAPGSPFKVSVLRKGQVLELTGAAP
jgi:serine protease Do